MIGQALSHYRITGKLGEGGMGEVYRATDTRLGREVAIKVLPAAFTADKERLARFEREAQLLAQLHHPSIASIFGLEESNGQRAIVMELVEGATLSERISAGPLPIDECLAIARQIADALEDAHEKGIIHRDLKPQNVKLTRDGKVKVLDFGLAKAMDPSASGTVSASQVAASPTLTLGATQQGVILGTAAYMSPEQAKGQAVDRRADVWAFGVVVYEMLTGTRLFEAPSVAEILALVLTRTPDLSALPPATPPALRSLLRRCLERNPKNRLHDIADARITLDELARGEGEAAPVSAITTPMAPPRRGLAPWALVAAALVFGALGWGAATLMRRPLAPAAAAPLTAFGVLVPQDRALPRLETPILDLSADGRNLVFIAEGKDPVSIYWRAFDRLDLRKVAGTEGATQPALSADARWIAFFAGGALRKVPAEGGTAVELAEARAPRGAVWIEDGSLVYSPVYNSALLRVPATGGPPKAVTTLDAGRQERSHRWPEALPGGQTVLFTVGIASSVSDYDSCRIDAVRLATGERKTVLEGARMARYSGTGHLVFQRRSSLLAVRFDPVRLTTLSEPFTIQENVGGELGSGAGYFAVSRNGVLAFVPESALPNERVLVLVDRDGKETELGTPAAYSRPRVSPDGGQVALGIGSGNNLVDDDVFVLDLGTRQLRRLTHGKGQGSPMWSPDGRRIVYTDARKGAEGISMRAADGSGEAVQVVKGQNVMAATSWLPDGRVLATDTEGSNDVRILDLKSGVVAPLYASPSAAEYEATASPDGRYIAYASTESGSDQIYVETWPGGGGKWQVSNASGANPVWARDGRRLYFNAGETIMEVEVDTRGIFTAGIPHALFTGPYELRTPPIRNFDVTPDGRFVLVKRRFASATPRELVVLDGWTSLDPAGKAAR